LLSIADMGLFKTAFYTVLGLAGVPISTGVLFAVSIDLLSSPLTLIEPTSISIVFF
jgi:hypothetical protein